MRYAVFSDIHGNLDAFQKLLSVLDGERIDKKIFLGDVVGYGADPNECVELVRESADIVLGGNHDYAAVGKTDITYFNEFAKAAILWTRQVVTDANKEYLKKLPVMRTEDGITFAHSSPWEPGEWHYILKISDAGKNFDYFSDQICFIGHSHHPIIISLLPDGTINGSKEKVKTIEAGCKYIINDGSVGQPRDGNPDLSYCIYDSVAKTVETVRVAYDVEGQQAKMSANGLPDYLVDRIAIGR